MIDTSTNEIDTIAIGSKSYVLGQFIGQIPIKSLEDNNSNNIEPHEDNTYVLLAIQQRVVGNDNKIGNDNKFGEEILSIITEIKDMIPFFH